MYIAESRILTAEFNPPTILKLLDSKEMTCCNPVQRDYVWNDLDKSRLVYSMLTNVVINKMVMNKYHDEIDIKKVIFDVIDGKQRLSAIYDLVKDNLVIQGIDPIYIDELGEEIDLNGHKFSEFPDEIKNKINSKIFEFVTYDDLDDSEAREVFSLYNAGKALSRVELLRSNCPSFTVVNQIAQHDLFKSMLSDSSIKKYKNEDIVFKTIQILTSDEPSFDAKTMKPFISTLVVTEEQKEDLVKYFDRLFNAYKSICTQMETTTDTTVKSNCKKVLTKMARQLHIISLISTVKKSFELNITDEQFTEFVKYFFTTEGKKCSINQKYNQSLSSGTGKKEKVIQRRDESIKEFDKFVKTFVVNNTTLEDNDTATDDTDNTTDSNK